MKTLFGTALALLLLLAPPLLGRAVAQAGLRESALILRILSYDRNLAQRTSRGVRVIVAYKAGDGASERERDEIVSALGRLAPRTKVAGQSVSAVRHAYTSKAALEQYARTQGAAAIYVCRGLSNAASAIRQASRATKTLTITPNESLVRSGLGVGLVSAGSKIKLVINLSAVQAEGARLDAAVLRLAEVIR